MTDSDFFNSQSDGGEAVVETEPVAEPAKPEEPAKIKVGDEELTQEELEGYVKLGKIGKELETKWNTKIESVYPKFTEATQKLKEKEQEEERRSQEEIARKQASGQELSQEEVQKQVEAELKKLGFVKESEVEEKARNIIRSERQADKLLDECMGYEKEIDGKDGRPAFKAERVLEYMREESVKDPMKAYKLMNEEALDRWKEEQLTGAKGGGMVTIEGEPGNKQPAPTKVTNDNLRDMIHESLGITD